MVNKSSDRNSRVSNPKSYGQITQKIILMKREIFVQNLFNKKTITMNPRPQKYNQPSNIKHSTEI
jgi:hypothetical protein